MNKYRAFSKRFIYIFIIFFALVIGLNYLFDPSYIWKEHGVFSVKKKDYNERVQKTNYLRFVNNNYDAVLLGNSRSTYINAQELDKEHRVFNYSVSAMSIFEYEQAILNFIELTGKEPKIVYIGVDPLNLQGEPAKILKQAKEENQELFYRIKALFSLDLVKISARNLLLTINYAQGKVDRKQRFFDENLIKGIQYQNKVSNKPYIELFQNSQFRFKYSRGVKEEYQRLISRFPSVKFIAFTQPVHSDLYNSWKQSSDFDKNMGLWLKDMVNTFGELYHFMYDTTISQDYRNFFDAYHFYPSVGQLMVDRMNREDFSDGTFGIKLNEANIKTYLEEGRG